MLLLALFAAAGLATTPVGAVTTPSTPRRRGPAQAFHIPYTHAYSPSGRVGSGIYCRVDFNVTDMATGTSTKCAGERGPCNFSSPEPQPEKPLDRDHPAICDDPSFSFYVTAWEYVSNYSIVVTHEVSSDDGGEEGPVVVHTGPSGPLDYETYRDSFWEQCAASGFCDAIIENATHPIVIPFA